ncbi:unnamed protein product [Phaedon cochleariae]|uniref:Uncharacterized protein n=1 Tax=Phaedon cochleariae TaxID=80249 RepID=A0A9N9SKI7_PHACE|nr:unnamed protein product [Phaedon cochleariae]
MQMQQRMRKRMRKRVRKGMRDGIVKQLMDHEADFESREDCFREVEESLKISLPISLKNVLRMNAFNNAAVLRDITEKDFEDMEKFMASETTQELIPKSEYEQYYGIFDTNPEKFQFLLGHKKLLLLIRNFFREKLEKRDARSEMEPQTDKRRTLNNLQYTSNPTSSASSSVILATDLTSENKQVAQTVRNWIKGKCTSDKQWEYFKDKFSQMSFEIKLNTRNDLCCTMTCYCMSKYKIVKSAQKMRYSERWVYGNFHKHLIKHFNQSNEAVSIENPVKHNRPVNEFTKNEQGTKKQHSKQPGIMNYFTMSGASRVTTHINTDSSNPSCTEESTARNESDIISELNNEVVESRDSLLHVMDRGSYETVEQEAHSPNIGPKINILSNQVITVQAMVHSCADGNPPREFPQKNMNSMTDSELNADEEKPMENGNNKTMGKWRSEKYQRKARTRRKLESKIVNQPVITSFLPLLSTVEKEVENIVDVTHGNDTETMHATLGGQISEKSEEGVFDYDGLCKYLEDRNLPKVVWISEDGTRVTGRIEYDSKSNKLVGFTLPLIDGLPKTNTFIATSAKAIQDYFLSSSKSNYAYVVMAQPLSKSAPPFCLVIFGTDNKFDSNDVTKRWEHIKENLRRRGITVLGFSSDGDTRLLKTMRQHASLPPQVDDSTYMWQWYQAGYKKDDPSYVQDTVHIATKLRTRFLNSKVTLIIGSFTAKPEHLKQLIDNFSKDKHLLTASDLKAEDKMCFRSAEKMSSESVIQLLKDIPGSDGTRAYLRLMQYAIASFMDPSLDTIKKKRLRIKRPKKNTSKKSNSESSDDDESSVEYDDSTDTENFSDETDENMISSDEIPPGQLTVDETNSNLADSIQPECGKFYAIYYEERWYLGSISRIVDSEYVVKFLRKKRGSETKFLWKKPDDISTVLRQYIFYGPIEADEHIEVLQLSDLQLAEINQIYSKMKNK